MGNESRLMKSLPLIGAGIGLIGGIGQIIGAGKANRQLRNLQGQNPQYKANPLADQRLGLATTLFNARTPGAALQERNIYANQANQISNINRAATDSSQALAMATGTQGTTNEAFNQLAMNEANDYQRRYGNMSQAQDGVIQEGDKVFNDQVRNFQDKVQIQGAIAKNNSNAWGSISNAGFGLASYGMNGGGGSGGGGNSIPPPFAFGDHGFKRPTYNPSTGRMG